MTSPEIPAPQHVSVEQLDIDTSNDAVKKKQQETLAQVRRISGRLAARAANMKETIIAGDLYEGDLDDRKAYTLNPKLADPQHGELTIHQIDRPAGIDRITTISQRSGISQRSENGADVYVTKNGAIIKEDGIKRELTDVEARHEAATILSEFRGEIAKRGIAADTQSNNNQEK